LVEIVPSFLTGLHGWSRGNNKENAGGHFSVRQL
jgi:hypothetical protein